MGKIYWNLGRDSKQQKQKMVTAHEILCLHSVILTSRLGLQCIALVFPASPIPDLPESRYTYNKQRGEKFPT